MSRIESWFEQDLMKPVRVHSVDTLFSQDGNANLIGVKVTKDEEPVALSGSVTGYCVLSDGGTVPVSGVISGNQAYIVVPPSAYNVLGPISIVVKNTQGTAITTLCAVVGMVTRSRTGAQTDPGSVVTDWTNNISAQLQACQNAADNVGAIVAVPYASLTFPVEVGTYTTYNGNLYCCISKISSSESFTAGHWRQTKVGDEINYLKDASNGIAESLFKYRISMTWAQGSISSTGKNNSSDTVNRTGFLDFSNYSAILFEKASALKFFVVEYTGNTTEDFLKIITPVYDFDDLFVFAPVSGHYYRFAVKRIDEANLSPSDSVHNGTNLYGVVPLNVNMLDMVNGTQIPSGSDLDDYTDAGRYYVASLADDDTIDNSPKIGTGYDLYVTKRSRGSEYHVRQIAFQNNKNNQGLYVRYKTESGWGDWRSVGVPNETRAISSGDDLDDYNTVGRYSSVSTAITQSLDNCPLSSTGFDLLVTSTSGHDDGTYIRQILIKNSKTDNAIYIRYKGLTWGEWQKIDMTKLIDPENGSKAYVSALSSRVQGAAKITINVGTFNVARYNHDTDVYLDNSENKSCLFAIRKYINSSELNILFTQEDTGYIDSNSTKKAFDYLLKPFFNADPVNSGSSDDVARANKKIYTNLPFSTNGTVVHVANLYPSAVYPSDSPYAGLPITAYYVWTKQTLENVGTIMLINIHNFYNGGKGSNSEWHPYSNRVNFLSALSTFLQSQTYDYCIIAGDFNASNYDGKDASGKVVALEDPIADYNAILSFCSSNNLIPVNGSYIGWFKTTNSHCHDNILVSNNIRIEKITCETYIHDLLYSDHSPVVAKLSLT